MVARYHPLLVALHWLVALLIVGNLIVGAFVLEPLANTDPAKLAVLRWHMVGGVAILALMLVRIVTRLATVKPSPASGGRWAHRLARTTHWLFYAAIFAMTISGLGMAQLGGFLPLIGGAPVTLPVRFDTLPPHAGHALFAVVLAVLFALHLAGVAYHVFVKREPLLRRMAFGPRADEAAQRVITP